MLDFDVNNKIDIWKNKLLDLGKKNKLLNYKLNSKGTLSFIVPNYIDLWNYLVCDEKSLEIPYYNNNININNIENQNIFEVNETPIKKVNLTKNNDDTQIEIENKNENETFKTNQSVEEMQKTLRALRSKAKTSMEEQGINILYLSFGFLKWTESDTSRYVFTSPIVLVPVKLTVDSITSPFVLSLYEDEIVVNPTLAYKLENDFGISLPQLNDDDTIETYLKRLDKITKNNNWEISADVSLGLLSFLKINMYNDLDKHKDMIASNSVVKMICGIPDDTSNSEDFNFSNFDFDKQLKPIDVFQIVDADTSQQEAILSAKKGLSFVLQGPPGTGKSQTITNIIAECLADGKKILFVSEKMAALEVVHKRLSSANLDDFCLTLHNTKANKKIILNQLSNVLSLAEQKATLTDEVYQKLETLQADKEFLNDYANQLHTIVEPLGKSIYQVNGIIANLSEYDEVIFSIDNVANISKEQYNKYIYLLSQFADTISRMTNDYKTNPWNDTNITVLTNELRHDISANLNDVIPKLDGVFKEIQSICEDLLLNFDISYSNTKLLIELLNIGKNSHKIPVSWILGEDTKPLFDEISKCEKLNNEFNQIRNQFDIQYNVLKSNDVELSYLNFDDITHYDTIKNILKTLKDVLIEKSPYNRWDINKINSIRDLFFVAKENYLKIQELSNKILKDYEKTIFDIDYNDIYNRYKTEYTSFFKVFKKSYKDDKNKIRLCYKNIIKKIPDSMVLEVVSILREIETLKSWFKDNNTQLNSYFDDLFEQENPELEKFNRYFNSFEAINKSCELLDRLLELSKNIQEMEISLKNHYEFLYDGFNTDWSNIKTSLFWSCDFRSLVELNSINHEFVELICNGEISNKCAEYQEKIENILLNIQSNLDWYLSLYNETSSIELLEYPQLKERLISCANGLHLLEEWIDFIQIKNQCRNIGLTNFISKVEELNILANNIVPIFKKRFFCLWLDAILPNYPAVLNFRKRNQENTIQEFANLDKLQFEIAKARIKSILINNLPNLNNFTSGKDEYSILKRELSKQRRIMPIRKLFNEIPNLLLRLKPCLMMSPLSVSLFLEAENYQFDVVIFDEASQVCTENAIGAISRGKQVIIAGDSKQLPPTSFFTSSNISDGDFDNDDEYDDSNDYESILDEANLLPQKTLLWHYRSRHEHLIAFSNARIYNNNLVTFPSNIDKVSDNGVEYFYVKDGYYDRGGKKGNIIEAKRVVELIFEHFQKFPNRSLGVIAFGEVQQQAIDNILRDERLKHQEFEHFFNENIDDAFFIKNLENVQGDERDTIIFSIGYAKDIHGVFRMNFGPLSKTGGERRLNVAITRAKYNIKLVGSILPTDINIDKVSTQGPKLLREYINFAMNGFEVLNNIITESDIIQHDSPFETAVYNVLIKHGYNVKTQVGCSGYRIDMAVKHPSISGIFVLGIECDGATYHSSRTARERDRLRQDVLENMGWKIYRIWSTDWIKDPIIESKHLLNAVENAIANYDINNSNSLTDNSETLNISAESFINVDEKTQEDTKNQIKNFYGLLEYPLKDISIENYKQNDYINYDNYIYDIVSVEYPIHYDLLCQKVAPLCNNKKVTSTVKSVVDKSLNRLSSKLVFKDNFVSPIEYNKINIYTPNTRKIDYISTEELAQAMVLILNKFNGISKENLISQTNIIYGFKRSTQKICSAMNNAFNFLLNNYNIQNVNDRLFIQD